MKKLKSSSRFIDNNDGTITDTQKHIIDGKEVTLTWAKEDDGVGRDWQDAKKYCEENEAKLPGEGWHLPTREELLTIVDLKRYDPAADPILNMRSSWYWSSTPRADGSVGAWFVGFYVGSVDWGGVSYYYYVRPVRQNSL